MVVLCRSYWLLLLVALVAPVSAAEFRWSPAAESEAGALLAKFMRGRASQGGEPGSALSFAIGLNGQIAYAGGLGETAPGQAVSEQTRFRIGSVTKQLTAAAVLKSVELEARVAGAETPLSLMTPVQALFDGVEHWSLPNAPPITLRSLLTMTSNLPNFTRRPPPAADPWGAIPAPVLMGEVKKLAPHGWPNSFEYSNTSYFVLAEVLDQLEPRSPLAARGYKSLMRTAIFEPAGMAHTTFFDDEPGVSDIAPPTFRRAPAFNKPDWLKGSGDVVSTVMDLHGWHTALMEGRILSDASLALMFSDAAHVSPHAWYGMGWFIEHRDGFEVYSHSGSVPGYTSLTVVAQAGDTKSWLSISLLTNSDGVQDMELLADDLLRLAVHERRG